MSLLGLKPNRIAWNGKTAGVSGDDDFGIDASDPITGMGQPAFRTSLRDRGGDGQEAGAQTRGSRTVEATLWTPDYDRVEEMEALMDARPHPADHLPWTYRIMDKAERRLYVRPERFDYSWGRVEAVGNVWKMRCQWLAADPVKYSEEQRAYLFGTGSATHGLGTSPAAYFDVPVVNAGHRAVRSGRAFELRITAHGPVVNPYIHIEGSGSREGRERITWHLEMASGQVLLTDDRLNTRIGSLKVNGKGRTGASPFLCWPRLEHGRQVIRVGCTSGTVSGYIKTRDAW